MFPHLEKIWRDAVRLAQAQTLTNKTLTSPVLDTGVSGTAVATQTAMQTGTSAILIPSIAMMKYLELMPKAIAVFDGTTAGTNAPTWGFGVTSITRDGTGLYTANLGVTFAAANYGMTGTCLSSGGVTSRTVNRVAGGTYTTIACQFTVVAVSDVTSAAAADSSWITVAFYGTLA